MFKNICKFEIAIGDKVYHFMCDSDSPIEHVKEAIFQIQKLVGQVEDQIKQQLEKAKETSEVKENV